ncbi:Uma2 family endonuclease [Actinoplanes sp. CA-030573]|uniref:Uma2 family endonuclease n=1 Tax=Actinoplanes sp. CA-030573 TaxID=3239898 RepID=UPI003D92AFCB
MDIDPIEEDSMTAALPLAGQDLIDYLLGRDDLTVDDLTDLPEDLRCELIDGRLVLTPNALPIHQTISMRLGYALEENCPPDLVVNVEQRVLLDRRNEFRPDVMVFTAEGSRRSPVPAADTLLVVEVISPSSRRNDRRDKLERYADLRIPAYWIIDPLAERVTFTQYLIGPDGAYEGRPPTDELVVLDQPWKITLDLPAWTRRRAYLDEAARP